MKLFTQCLLLLSFIFTSAVFANSRYHHEHQQKTNVSLCEIADVLDGLDTPQTSSKIRFVAMDSKKSLYDQMKLLNNKHDKVKIKKKLTPKNANIQSVNIHLTCGDHKKHEIFCFAAKHSKIIQCNGHDTTN